MPEMVPTPVTPTEAQRTEIIRRLALFKRLKERAREAAGFVLASVRSRLQDAADLVWHPVDAMLASRVSYLIALIPTLGAGLLVIRDGGVYGLINATPALASI
jgi:hypothetical protein